MIGMVNRRTRFNAMLCAYRRLAALSDQHVGLGMVAEVDYPVIDVQLDRTVSHDGKRNNQGFTSQTSGIYPGWDRFGRVKKHAWVDGNYTTGTGSNPSAPPLAEIDYTYDRSSNRLTRTDARPGASWADRDFRYEYDGLDRLVQADRGAEGGSWSAAVGGQQWALDMLGNWDSIFNDTNGDGNYTSSSPDEEQERTHNFANEIEDITSLPFAYDAAGNMTEQGLPAAATKYYTHDAWNRQTEVKIDAAVLGQYEYNALHWRSVKRARSPGAGSLDEMRLMYYSANWQLLEERIDRSWTSGFTEDERAQTFWGKRYIDDAVARRRDRDANGTYDNNFFYVTDAQFSTVAMVSASNARVVERVTYDSYGKARHHFGGDVTGDGAATPAGDDAALVTTIGLGSNSIGQANYKAEQDLNRDGTISTADRTTLAALTGGADQAALASGLVSFTTTGSGASTVHGPDNSIAWDGYVFNAETGQYLVRFRWYDPVLGRWLERDFLNYPEGLNSLQYCKSQPLGLLDPNGLASCSPPGFQQPDSVWQLMQDPEYNLRTQTSYKLARWFCPTVAGIETFLVEVTPDISIRIGIYHTIDDSFECCRGNRKLTCTRKGVRVIFGFEAKAEAEWELEVATDNSCNADCPTDGRYYEILVGTHGKANWFGAKVKAKLQLGYLITPELEGLQIGQCGVELGLPGGVSYGGEVIDNGTVAEIAAHLSATVGAGAKFSVGSFGSWVTECTDTGECCD